MENNAQQNDTKNDINTNNSNENYNESALQLYNLSQQFLKLFTKLCFIYILGYMGFSIAWILIGVFIWTLRHKYFAQIYQRISFFRQLATNEEPTITGAIKDLPSWVYFPDSERAEWINKIVKQMWPFIDEYVKTLIKSSIEPNIKSALPDFLKSFRFERVDLGSIPLRIGSVKCYDENTSRDEIIFDMEIIYAGNCDIQISIKNMKAGIKHFQLYGRIRVELRPLLKDIPLVGCVSVYFLNNPAIEFSLTNLADILDIPGLRYYLRQAIREKLSALMVLPNKYVFPLINDISLKSIKFSQPVGVIRLEIIEARNLKKSDVGMLGLGKSDPYVIVLIGNCEYKSKVIPNTVNPKWNYICETVIYNLHDQNIEIEVMDEDQGSKDDFLGRTTLSLATIANNELNEAWITLKDVKRGAIHLKTTWFTLSTCISDLNETIENSVIVRNKYDNDNDNNQIDSPIFGAVGVILIYLDGARNLPVTKTMGEPDPYCVITVGNDKNESIVKKSTANPNWEEEFSYLIQHCNENTEIHFNIIDSKADRHLGSVSLKLEKVISSENMLFNEPLPISGRTTDCQLNISVSLRIMKCQKCQQIPSVVIEEPIEEICDEPTLPTIEDMIKGTVQPIIHTSGYQINKDVIEKSQNDRKHKPIKTSETNGKSEVTANLSDDQENHVKYPRILVTIQKSGYTSKPFLIVHKAENLPLIDGQKPNPYVKIYGTQGKNSMTLKKSLKSITKRYTCNPLFDENFELDNKWKAIDILVFSRNGSARNVFKKKSNIIGLTSIQMNTLTLESQLIKQWYELEQLSD
ncbi:extended synaptotagmin-2-like [Oppia nitens]|uniref:extended synaptotagmin-2-like n=1 Tax=Oppia nitens TaxID=1686743 RepID=UPI0023DC43A3|nr:extended synaptotagmin-2-like [Oppia nitens]